MSADVLVGLGRFGRCAYSGMPGLSASVQYGFWGKRSQGKKSPFRRGSAGNSLTSSGGRYEQIGSCSVWEPRSADRMAREHEL